MAGMSEAALKRCRRMTITSDKEDSRRKTLEVFDPNREDKSIAKYTSRTRQDTVRVQRAWMSKYQIPQENITTVEFANAAPVAPIAD